MIVGGLAFIYHARPRYTKDMDLWIDPTPENAVRANEALAEFGSPNLLTVDKPDEILQLGLPPNRIDLLRAIEGPSFDKAWQRRIRGKYGQATVNWIDLDSLIEVKSRISSPRHKRDVRDLEKVRKMRKARPSMRTLRKRTTSR